MTDGAAPVCRPMGLRPRGADVSAQVQRLGNKPECHWAGGISSCSERVSFLVQADWRGPPMWGRTICFTQSAESMLSHPKAPSQTHLDSGPTKRPGATRSRGHLNFTTTARTCKPVTFINIGKLLYLYSFGTNKVDLQNRK